MPVFDVSAAERLEKNGYPGALCLRHTRSSLALIALSRTTWWLGLSSARPTTAVAALGHPRWPGPPCAPARRHYIPRVSFSSWMCAYARRIELPDHWRGLLVRCRATEHRAESRSPVLPLDRGWTGRRPSPGKVSGGYQGQEEGDSGCNPRCQLMIVNARPSDLRSQKSGSRTSRKLWTDLLTASTAEVYPTFWVQDG